MNMIDFFDFSLKQKETIQTWNIFDHLIATQSGMSGKCGIKDPLPPSPTRLSLQESTWDLEFQQREAGPAHKNYAWYSSFFPLALLSSLSLAIVSVAKLRVWETGRGSHSAWYAFTGHDLQALECIREEEATDVVFGTMIMCSFCFVWTRHPIYGSILKEHH